MPTSKQMEGPAVPIGGTTARAHPLGPQDQMPDEYWHAVLNDAHVDTGPLGRSNAGQRLCDIQQHILRVCCRRCERVVEIQKIDAARLYGDQAVWRDVAMRLLDNTCQQRTGRHEEDGCWPSFD